MGSRRSTAPTVTVRRSHARSRAVVSASGKIHRSASSTSGGNFRACRRSRRNEGRPRSPGPVHHADRPRTLRTRVESASRMSGAEAAREQHGRASKNRARAIDVAQQNLKRQKELWNQQLTRARSRASWNDVRIAQSTRSNGRSRCAPGGPAGPGHARSLQRSVRSSKVRIERRSRASSPAATFGRRNRRRRTMNNDGRLLQVVTCR